MKLRSIASIVLPLVVGAGAALGTPIGVWVDMKEGLIAFLGFLAASLVQVMPLTANFIQADKLTPSQAEKLTKSLSRQQYYWVGLLASTVIALIVVIVVAAVSKGREEVVVIDVRDFVVSLGRILCFIEVVVVSFVFIKMWGLFEGMLSLHTLRGELVLEAARQAAKQQFNAVKEETFQASEEKLPVGYGAIVDAKASRISSN
ncbi:hypothetical protein KW843_22665 [Acidovorax sp. sif1233]|uniref:hypothetical protein n=1 Tax=Acidovorax sp. sif1233 TaxID=2854792 RepID=UPI001C44EFF1|nr:hypothetical protein [Acidovorax sp. sif1233]MBV7457301.1 hypothetical protein [Acidovorax sp. sif1233]